MNETTPPDNGATEPTLEQQSPEPTYEPTSEQPPSWALDKFKRNTVVGGAAIAGAVVALAGAALVGDDDHRGRGDFRGGPPGMMQGGPQQWSGPQGDGQFQQRGPGGPGMQGPGMQGPSTNDQQGQSGRSGSK